MAFCEECGTELTPGSRFCEECGAVVEYTAVVSKDGAATSDGLKEIFSVQSWKSVWERISADAKNYELGIILTREESLLSQIDVTLTQLHDLLRTYIDKALYRGVKYCYLNLDSVPFYDGDGDVNSVVAALHEVVEIARPKYLFILGNENVIDVARWENNASDGDDKVESDLCYSTLDDESPWLGQRYNFGECIRVGRLPTYSGERFEKFKSYFEVAASSIGQSDTIVPYGLSALVWEEESNYEFGKSFNKKVDVSPNVGHSSVSYRMGSEASLLFFNLHGSDRAKFWYGQNGEDYPTAFAPEILKGLSRPYFLGVEACYGARYLGGLTPDESILLTAMENKCVSFLGSSRIAFGTSSPTGSCADFIIGSYVSCIKDGESAGDSHIAGLKRLASDWDSMDDADVKTMAEFSLYGDPSVRIGDKVKAKGFKSLFSSFKAAKGMSISMPDVSRAVRMSIVEVDAKIHAIIDDYVKRDVLPELSDAISSGVVKMTTLKMAKTGLNQKIYSYSLDCFDVVAKIYFEDNGTIKRTLISK